MRVGLVVDDTNAAKDTLEYLRQTERALNFATNIDEAEIIVVIGGDGFMLRTLRRRDMGDGRILFGLNAGNVGFLSNEIDPLRTLQDRLENIRMFWVNAIRAECRDYVGNTHSIRGYNEILIERQESQATNIEVWIDNRQRIGEFIGDGLVASTPIGSTGYNYSAGGSIIPIGHNLMSLAPLAPYRPKRWKGAILPGTSRIKVINHNHNKRPIQVVADSAREVFDVVEAELREDTTERRCIAFDNDYSLEERVIKEQFE